MFSLTIHAAVTVVLPDLVRCVQVHTHDMLVLLIVGRENSSVLIVLCVYFTLGIAYMSPA